MEQARPGVHRGTVRCYEFGAGWDLIGPIAMWALGVDHQTLVDIRPNVKLDLVNDTVVRFARDRIRLQRALGDALRPMSPEPIASTRELSRRFGITYLAPQDARSVPLPDGSVDLVTSTFTLEHIPPADIAAILAETRRLLAPTGVVSCLIDMYDHYAYTDPAISAYNFLRFPGWIWRFLNPSLGWQSRLRYSQYRELFAQAGYEILADAPHRPTDAELRALGELRLAPEFRGFAASDLGTTAAHIVAAPAG